MKLTINIPENKNLESPEVEFVLNTPNWKTSVKMPKRELLAIHDALNSFLSLPQDGLTELEITSKMVIKPENQG